LLTGRELDAALGGHYVPQAGMHGWVPQSATTSLVGDPLYAVNHEYRKLGEVDCVWTKGRLSGQYADFQYILAAYPTPVTLAAMREADTKLATAEGSTAIKYTPVSNVGRWAGTASNYGQSLVRVLAADDVITIVASGSATTPPRHELVELATLIAHRLA
jgi:hypothetical protein